MEITKTREFEKWFLRLKSREAKSKVQIRIRRLALTENLGDAKALGGGIFELRIDSGPGIRIYYALRGDEIILLLLGGDKASQQRDISRARLLNQLYCEE